MRTGRLGPGFVYFLKPVGLPGPIKIGFSQAPLRRIESFINWSPLRLEIIVAIPGRVGLEVAIQNCVALSHSHCEWFLPTDKVTNLVAALVDGVSIERAIDLSAPEGSVRSKYTRGVPRPNGRGPRTSRLRIQTSACAPKPAVHA